LPDFLLWDTFLSPEKPEKKHLAPMRDSMIEIMDERARHLLTHESNLIMKGQTRSRAGSIGGLRLVFDIGSMDTQSVENLVNNLRESQVMNATASGNFFTAWNIPIPLDLDSISVLPMIGTIVISTQFTHGLGQKEARSINTIRQNQARETKNWLNFSDRTNNRNYISSELSECFGGSYWYLVKFPGSDGGSSGGAYQLTYTLHEIVDELTTRSKGAWWEPVVKGNESTPRIQFDASQPLKEIQFDPNNWYLHSSVASNNREAMSEVEMLQSGDSDLVDELEYVTGRMMRPRRPNRTLGMEDGLVAGYEEATIKQEVLNTWVRKEFFHNIALFLYTRSPKYWLNGKASIWLIDRMS